MKKQHIYVGTHLSEATRKNLDLFYKHREQRMRSISKYISMHLHYLLSFGSLVYILGLKRLRFFMEI